MTDSAIFYYGSSDEVRLGDRISTRLLFRKRIAEVVYVPGISKFSANLEHHGLRWVGMLGEDGSRFASLVDPESGRLAKKIKLLSRGSSAQEPNAGELFSVPGEIVDD